MALQKNIDIGSGFICNYIKITNINRDIQENNANISLCLFKDKDTSVIGSKKFGGYNFPILPEEIPFQLQAFLDKQVANVPLDKIVLAICYDFIKNKIDNDIDHPLYGYQNI